MNWLIDRMYAKHWLVPVLRDSYVLIIINTYFNFYWRKETGYFLPHWKVRGINTNNAFF